MTSLPENLVIKKSSISNAGMGVFTKEKPKMNTRFGPYKGTRVAPEDVKDDTVTSYMWEVGSLSFAGVRDFD